MFSVVVLGLWHSGTTERLLIGSLSTTSPSGQRASDRKEKGVAATFFFPCYTSAVMIRNSICLLAPAFISAAGTFITMDTPHSMTLPIFI